MGKLFVNAFSNGLTDFVYFLVLLDYRLLYLLSLFFVFGGFSTELNFEIRDSFGKLFCFWIKGWEFGLEDFVQGFIFGKNLNFFFFLDPLISKEIPKSTFQKRNLVKSLSEIVESKLFKLLNSGENIVFWLLNLFAFHIDVFDRWDKWKDFILELLDNMLEFGLVIGHWILHSEQILKVHDDSEN